LGVDALLIAPSDLFYDKNGEIPKKSSFPPLGLLYIASKLLENGFGIKVIDLNCEVFMTSQRFIQLLNMYEPSLIGLSSTSSTFTGLLNVATICKDVLPEVPIIVGGQFATFCHEKMLQAFDCFDMVVRGEGEYTLLQIMRELEKRNQEFSSIRGLSYRSQGRVYVNDSRPPIDNLDSLPFPNYDLVSKYDYRSVHGLRISSKNVAGMLSTRG
jgi:radical SAM superfamily enzyme YgiQ (UPF0313 family)